MDWLTDINVHWYLLPLIISISIVYSATRFENWSLIWYHSVRWAIYIVTFLAGVYGILFLVHWLVNPVWIFLVAATAVAYLFLSGRKSQPSGDAAGGKSTSKSKS